MRGKPTVDGEADIAQLRAGMFTLGGTPVTSPALAGESVTTSAPVPGAGGPRHGKRLSAGATWEIRTLGMDSYDVADVTVTYRYLTPQQ